MSNTTTSLDTCIANLRVARQALLAIDDNAVQEMEPASREEWANNLRKLTVTINKLDTAKQRTLSDRFKARQQELEDATDLMKTDLESLSKAIHVIGVISGGLGLISNIVGLLR